MYGRATYRADNQVNWRDIKDPVSTIKYDGAHFFMRVESDGSMRFFSRRPSVKGGFPERTSQLLHVVDKKMPQYAGQIFATELIHTGHNKLNVESNTKLSGILNSLAPRAIATQALEGPVRVVLLDVLEPRINTYGEKLVHMKKFENDYARPNLVFTPTPVVHPKQIEKLIEQTKKQGREGVIITSLTEPEAKNKRVKLVHVEHLNLLVTKVIQEKDNYGRLKDSMGALEVSDRSGRVVANVGTGFSAADRQEIWRDPTSWVNKAVIQVKHKGLASIGGRLRAPVYGGLADGSVDLVE